jgi:hypothetical protein
MVVPDDETQKMRAKAQKIAQFINSCLPKGIGFALFLFQSGSDELFWLSNVDRSKLIKPLEDLLEKTKKGDMGERMYGSRTVH